MKLWIATLGMFLGGVLAGARADYIKIIYNPSVVKGTGTGSGTSMTPRPSGPGVGMSPRPSGPGMPTMPGMGALGGTMPRTGVPPAGGLNQAGDDEEDFQTSSTLAEVVVEVKDVNQIMKRRGILQIKTKFGSGWITPVETSDIKFLPVVLPTVAQRYKIEKEQHNKKTAEDELALAEWTLKNNLLDEFVSHMNELKKLDPNHPAVMALTQMQEAMQPDKINKDDSSRLWKERLGNFKELHSDHYTLLYKTGSAADLQTRLSRLENTYHAFFYWFALKGKARPVPSHRLLAIVVDKDQFEVLHGPVFDAGPLVDDGFTVHRDDLVVFSADPLEPAYDALDKSTKDMWTSGWSKTDLLNGKLRQDVPLPESLKAQMIALLLRAIRDEAETATVTDQGTRQLVGATGMLPAGVEAPQWIQFGIGSFFETSKGAYWSGVGTPSWRYLPRFRLTDRAQKLDKASEALMDVVTDRNFRAANTTQDQKVLLKARTMAWALTYFLANRRLDNLLTYYDQLSQLPRDMAFQDDVYLLCFARAFGLMNSSKPDQIDPLKLTNFANDWYAEIKGTPMQVDESKIESIRAFNERSKKGTSAKPAGS